MLARGLSENKEKSNPCPLKGDLDLNIQLKSQKMFNAQFSMSN
jgi:hypothetical protein